MYRVVIPEHYVWMTKESLDRAVLFKRYVKGYLAKTYPELQLVKIQGMTALCEMKEEAGGEIVEVSDRFRHRRSNAGTSF